MSVAAYVIYHQEIEDHRRIRRFVVGATPFDSKRPSFAESTAWNSLSVFIQTAAVQAIVFPVLGKLLPAEAFGRLLTVVAIATIVGMVCGSASSNLAMRDFSRQHDQAGYRPSWATLNTCFLLLIATGGAAVLLISIFLGIDNPLLLTILAVAIGTRTYLSVDARLKLVYRKIALSNGVATVGYGLGLLSFWLLPDTPPLVIFLGGEIFAVLFLARHATLLASGISWVGDASNAIRTSMGFAASAMATNLQSYADRFVLVYVIGESAVAVFFVASLGGRLAQTVVNVIANVSLSYLSNMPLGHIRYHVIKVCIYPLLASIGTWILVVTFFPVLLALLYPQFIEEARPLLGLVTAGFAIGIVEMLLRPLTIRAISIRALTTLEIITTATYYLIGLQAAQEIGLEGFAIACIIIVTAKIAVQAILLFQATRAVN